MINKQANTNLSYCDDTQYCFPISIESVEEFNTRVVEVPIRRAHLCNRFPSGVCSNHAHIMTSC